MYPLLRYFGYGLDLKEAIILVWSGLRGAVSLALALSFKRTSDAVHPYLKPEVGTMFVFFTGGIVFLTLIVNGSTTQLFLHMFGMYKLSASKVRILKYTRHELLNKALEAFGELRDDEELGPADWVTVKKYITCLHDLGDELEHPHDVSDRDSQMHAMNLRDIRVRLLSGVQAAYWGMLEEGRITRATANILMRSVDEAMDLISRQPLCDWKGLQSSVQFPSYYRFLQMTKLPRELITYFIVERLESGCYVCAAFLRAHRIARRQLHDFLGDSEVARIVIDESNAEGEEAKKFMEDVRVTFPQVLHVLKTRQVAYSVLTNLSEYIQNLKKTGLLEQREMIHLDNAVQTDIKKLKRNPPMVTIPSLGDLLNSHPLVGALPDIMRDLLFSKTKETVRGHCTVLYKEGSRPSGVWLVSIGVVKWTSQRLSSRHSLDPILSSGCTLGLYEVLIGKPYICDMITDSLVHCFFVDAEKIQQLRQSDPSIEVFLWQESTLVIARLLLPQIFEKMAMHEIRIFIAERSTVNMYIKGENIELEHNYICILLEGFLKTKSQNLITPPAVLLPSNTDLTLFGLESSDYCYAAPSYQVEARARIIFFKIGGVSEIEADFQRTTSILSQTHEPPQTRSKEHSGLLSWPETLWKTRGSHNINLAEIGSQPDNLSTRAAQLSMYGSMREDRHLGEGHRQQLNDRMQEINLRHSSSYPGVSSRQTNTRPLLSMQSEGFNMNRTPKEAGEDASPPPVTQLRSNAMKDDNSMDESVGDEVIIRVDSPRMLSSRQSSGALHSPLLPDN